MDSNVIAVENYKLQIISGKFQNSEKLQNNAINLLQSGLLFYTPWKYQKT